MDAQVGDPSCTVDLWLVSVAYHIRVCLLGVGFHSVAVQAQFPNLSGEAIALQEGLTPNLLLLFGVVSAEYLGVGLGNGSICCIHREPYQQTI